MTAPPGKLADRPATPADPRTVRDAVRGLDPDGQSYDLLSELLRRVRLGGERIVVYAPGRSFSIGFGDTGSLHIIEEGELVLRLDGNPLVEHVRRGDVVLLPRGDAHHLSDARKYEQAIRAWPWSLTLVGRSGLVAAVPCTRTTPLPVEASKARPDGEALSRASARSA